VADAGRGDPWGCRGRRRPAGLAQPGHAMPSRAWPGRAQPRRALPCLDLPRPALPWPPRGDWRSSRWMNARPGR